MDRGDVTVDICAQSQAKPSSEEFGHSGRNKGNDHTIAQMPTAALRKRVSRMHQRLHLTLKKYASNPVDFLNHICRSDYCQLTAFCPQ